MSVLEAEYPDLYLDGDIDDFTQYFIGKSDDGLTGAEAREARSFLTYTQAVAFCGFCEGAIPESDTLIEGNGPWAQGMLSREDFSDLVCSVKEKSSYRRRSKLWWAAKKRGEKARHCAKSDAAQRVPATKAEAEGNGE